MCKNKAKTPKEKPRTPPILGKSQVERGTDKDCVIGSAHSSGPNGKILQYSG